MNWSTANKALASILVALMLSGCLLPAKDEYSLLHNPSFVTPWPAPFRLTEHCSAWLSLFCGSSIVDVLESHTAPDGARGYKRDTGRKYADGSPIVEHYFLVELAPRHYLAARQSPTTNSDGETYWSWDYFLVEHDGNVLHTYDPGKAIRTALQERPRTTDNPFLRVSTAAADEARRRLSSAARLRPGEQPDSDSYVVDSAQGLQDVFRFAFAKTKWKKSALHRSYEFVE